MKYGKAVHVSELKVGDVVRPVHGMVARKLGAPALEITLADGTVKAVDATRGWRGAEVGGVDDFRQGYDAMTVVDVTDKFVDFTRPYCHVYPSGIAHGLETVALVSRTGGYWYEMLQEGSK